jgi:glycosyltransferase involved in cell wall biosynthesis
LKSIKIVDIVIIGRNEEQLIRHAIESSLTSSNEIMDMGYIQPKIIYIDGQSSDRSLQIAQSYGIITDMVSGKPNPANGRHLGFQYCDSKYVFFLDGDMEIYPGWLAKGIQYLEGCSEVIAGVAGISDWVVKENGRHVTISNHSGIKKNRQEVTTDVGGGFLYRVKTLKEVGDFDPTMTRMGEFELYLRIVAGGSKLHYLFTPMIIHRDEKGSMGRNFLQGSILTKNVFIPGVIARKVPLNKEVISLLLKRYWLYILHSCILVCLWTILINGFSLTKSTPKLVISLLLFLVLFLAHFFYKNTNFLRALVSLVTINVYIPAFLFGYIFQFPNIGGYYSKKKKQ